MERQNDSSSNQGLLCRPRIHSLIDDGLRHPLLVILAGPGYGKTRAMADYLARCGGPALWFRLTELDNLPTHFWNHLVQALKIERPELSESLLSLGFPDTLSSFDAFVQLFEGYLPQNVELIWVFDDFGALNNEQIKNFFRLLVDMDLPQLRLTLISNELGSTESIAFFSNRRFLILAKDLRFNQFEIAQLYQMCGLPLSPDELLNIQQQTEGWPLSLHLLVQQGNRRPDSLLTDEDAISHMFEERFFSNYSTRQRLMLARLSLLNYFSRELAMDLYDGPPVEIEEMRQHAFLNTEPVTRRFFFHHLYHLFLRKKQYLLSEEDQRQVWAKAARYYADSGDVQEAVICCRRGGDRAGLLKIISDYAKEMHGLTEKDAGFFLEHLDLMAPEDRQPHPLAVYLRAHIYFNALKVDQAEALLVDLEKRLLGSGLPDEKILLGDLYILLGFIHMIRRQEDYGDYFETAAGYLPAGSVYQSRRKLMMFNNHSFALADNLPGAKERMEEAAYRAAPWMARVLHGCLSGLEHVISAESAFLSYDLTRAETQAYRAVYKAKAEEQHDLTCNAFFILARIGWLRGDLTEMSRQAQNIVEYVARRKIGVLEEIRDTAQAWYYLKLRDLIRIPQSIINMDYSPKPLLSYGRSQIVYADYLIVQEEYARVVGLLEHPRGLFLSDGIWHDRICLFVRLAIAYHRLGQPEAAVKALWTAYDMCRHNQISTVFIEAGSHMNALINLARRQGLCHFEADWLDRIYEAAAVLERQAEAVRAEYRRLKPAEAASGGPLSRREKEVLQALSQGLTREEIALKQFVSVNTVKSVIRSIYNKLNANNRAEAVSVAIANGYIEGYGRPHGGPSHG